MTPFNLRKRFLTAVLQVGKYLLRVEDLKPEASSGDSPSEVPEGSHEVAHTSEVKEVVPGLTRVEPSTPGAPARYISPDGAEYVLFARPADYQDADKPDDGQHDVWKKDLRIALWRSIHGPVQPGLMDMSPLGLGRRSEQVPVLYPFGEQLAGECRKLGYLNLARAAMPEASDDEIQQAYHNNAQAVRDEAARRAQLNAATSASWDTARMGGRFSPETEDQTIASLSLGPLQNPPGVAILKPLRLRSTEPTPYENLTRRKNV